MNKEIKTAKITFTADIAAFDMDSVVKKGKLSEYLISAMNECSSREYDFVFSNVNLRIEGEI